MRDSSCIKYYNMFQQFMLCHLEIFPIDAPYLRNIRSKHADNQTCLTFRTDLFPLVLNENNICIDGHFSCVLGSDAVLRHACFSGCNREIRDRRTSLGAGATERSDGAHEDNEGHESSHSNADDHRHWERLCREQQREVSYDHYILQTSRMYMKRESQQHTAIIHTPCTRPPFSFRNTHTPVSLISPSFLELREDLLSF